MDEKPLACCSFSSSVVFYSSYFLKTLLYIRSIGNLTDLWWLLRSCGKHTEESKYTEVFQFIGILYLDKKTKQNR